MNKTLVLCASLYVGLTTVAPSYADVTEPKFHCFTFGDNSTIMGMSDNGLWGVACAISSEDEMYMEYPKIINLTTDKVTELLTQEQNAAILGCGLSDISDDGTIAVGNYNALPSVYFVNANRWQQLDIPQGWTTGNVNAVTPDGTYAIGTICASGFFDETSVLWDLSDGGSIVELNNLPSIDMTGADQGQRRFIGISPDARYILGCLSYSYISPVGICYFVYDRTEEKTSYIGFNKESDFKWTPLAEGISFIDQAVMSSNGEWISGYAYMVKPIPGSEYPNEYSASFTYNVASGEFKLYDEADDADYVGFSVDSNGTIFAATPPTSATREMYIRSGKYWYSLAEILSQQYGITYTSATNFTNTGTPICVSADGKKVASLASSRMYSYVLELPTTFDAAANGVDLLASYTASPASGATISAMTTATLTFGRSIQILGSSSCVSIVDNEGKTMATSRGFQLASGSTTDVTITFRGVELPAGKTYSLIVPAGALSVANDTEKTNSEIKLTYTGRDYKPVYMTHCYPNNGASMIQLDYSTNPAYFYFDTDIALSDSAKAGLYKDDETDAICDLSLFVSGKILAVYPTTTQYLYKGSEYHIRIAAGSVTEINGMNGNEAISLSLVGAYEREVAFKDTILFEDDFDTYLLSQFMLYDGDGLEPNTLMSEWAFTATSTAWNYACDDDNYTDFCAVSHSMYRTPGRSDDWMVIPQVYVPNNQCYLTFNAQSYLKSKSDTLQIIVWEQDEVYNTMNESRIDAFKANGRILFKERLSPGALEGTLAGDWASYTISLADYADKNIYIAFVNQNKDQSCIFVNDVKVTYNQDFVLGLLYEKTVTKATEAEISGVVSVTGNKDGLKYTYAHITLKDGKGALVDSIAREGLELAKGDTLKFSFVNKLPLTMGKASDFTVTVDMNGEINTESATIKNLAFTPTRRVVVEEGTGAWCGNCPLGVLAFNNLDNIYGDKVIPVAVHYNDQFAFDAYISALGFSGYPTGMVNRNGNICAPAKSFTDASGNTVGYSYGDGSGDCWLDYVKEALEDGAEANVDVKAELNNTTISVPTTVTYAVDLDDVNVNVLYVITEDNLMSYQTNYFAGSALEFFGDFGANGKYGSSTIYPYYHNHVARAMHGMTTIGTGGLVPSEVNGGENITFTQSFNVPSNVTDINNCQVVCMLFDAATGTIINAASSKIEIGAGITGVENASANVVATEGAINVATEGHSVVSVYTANGSLLNRVAGNGNIEVATAGYKGMVIVNVVSAEEAQQYKVMAK